MDGNPNTNQATNYGREARHTAAEIHSSNPGLASTPSRPPTPFFVNISQHSIPYQTLLKRFWSRVRKTENCWIWDGSRKSDGYGLFFLSNKGKRFLYAHRVSLIVHGVHVPEHLCVIHTCDNPICVRPDHLRIGTKQQNSTDMVDKGRSGHPRKKLTANDALAIRAAHASGQFTWNDIANQFNITPFHVWRIITRRCWKDAGASAFTNNQPAIQNSCEPAYDDPAVTLLNYQGGNHGTLNT